MVLDEGGQPVEALAHVGVPGGQPDARAWTGRGSSTQQRGDRALQERQVRPDCGPHPVPARQLDLDQAGPAGTSAAVVTGGGRASGTKVGGAAEACCSTSKARRHRNSRLECRPCRRATSEAVVAGSSASAGCDGALLLGRPDAARARNDDVRELVKGPDTGPIQRHLAPAPVSRAKHYSHKAAFTERLRYSSGFAHWFADGAEQSAVRSYGASAFSGFATRNRTRCLVPEFGGAGHS